MHPPKLLENLVRILLPPASREHVLGDLQERYTSPPSYLTDALSVLGPVIISRIRRTTDLQVFLMETLTIYLSFATAGWYLGEQSFLYGHAGFVRLAVPTSVAVVALLFCNAYSNLERQSIRKAMLQSAGSLSLAFLGQAFIFDMHASLAVPFRMLLHGCLLSLLLVSPLRILFPPVHRLPKLVRPNKPQPFQRWQLIPTSSLQRLIESMNQMQSPPKLNWLFMFLVALLAAILLFAVISYPALPKPRIIVAALMILAVIFRIRMGD
jgi:hypothetical protein